MDNRPHTGDGMKGHSQKMAGGTHKGPYYLGHEWGVSDILVTEREEMGGVASERVRGYWGMGIRIRQGAQVYGNRTGYDR